MKNNEEEKIWTEEDIGTEVTVVTEGIRHTDIIVEAYLPDGQKIIGPRLKCGHIFARFSMIPAMEQASQATKDMIMRFGDDEYELLKLALTDKTICIDNVEKLVSLSSDHSRSAHILKQILAELAREERQPLARKGQMRRTGRNQ